MFKINYIKSIVCTTAIIACGQDFTNKNILLVEDIYGKTIVCDVNRDNTVSYLKNILYDKTGISQNDIKLICSNKVLYNNSKTISDYNIASDSVLKILLDINGGITEGPHPDKQHSGTGTHCSDSRKCFTSGLNVQVYCKKCGEYSMHNWGCKGVKFDKDTGFSIHDMITRSKCQYCYTAVEDSDDKNGDEQISVEGVYFYKCWFEFHGKVHKISIKNGDWKKGANVQTGLTMVKNSDYKAYYKDEFIHWASAKFRCGYYNG